MKSRRSSFPPYDESPENGERNFEIEEEEAKLANVNMQIKHTLTELLNCEDVRGDRTWRNWIHSRLMDAEGQLKECRLSRCHNGRRKSVQLD